MMVSNRSERLAPGSVLETDRGDLEVSAARPHKGRQLVSFTGIDSREAAEQLRGLVLRAVAMDDPDELWVHELVGCTVNDGSGSDRGVVTHVVVAPAGDLLELAGGQLVPVRFIREVVPGVRIEVDAPEGLFDSTLS